MIRDYIKIIETQLMSKDKKRNRVISTLVNKNAKDDTFQEPLDSEADKSDEKDKANRK